MWAKLWAYIIDIFIIVADVVELDLVVVSGSEGVRLVDFSCEEEEEVRIFYSLAAGQHFIYLSVLIFQCWDNDSLWFKVKPSIYSSIFLT